MFLMCACFVQKKGIAEKAINFILGRKKNAKPKFQLYIVPPIYYFSKLYSNIFHENFVASFPKFL